MSSLYDEIMAIKPSEDNSALIAAKEVMRKAEVFCATNVRELIDPHSQYDMVDDFPNAVPPYAFTWVEWDTRNMLITGMDGVTIDRIATLTQCVRTDNGFDLVIGGFIRSIWSGRAYADMLGFSMHLTMDQSGTVISHTFHNLPGKEVSQEVANQSVGAFLVTTLLTFSLLNCRNVSVEERKPHRKEVKTWEREHHTLPLVSFHTLNIKIMGHALRTEGNIATNGPAKALHLCRGHFKTYHEKKLFGKHTGTFYFGPTVKGNAPRVVVKDYHITT